MESSKDNASNPKVKNRGKKRKRQASGSSSEYEEVLPENAFDMEKNLHASAVKNNLDEISVRKILKKVVTNDHVLALVKLREEEEDSGPDENSLRPKLTRAKVKELMKVSPKTSKWNLENLELTPIKHIPVKTRPEVKALIAQELPDDEDDEEYEPTHEDVPSDDDQTLESCSDLDSQPRTPATPRRLSTTSPKVVKDGPFKVPQDVSTPTRRKLNLEEEATIALRTRSKLSLSATSIEHIESTFVPPDDLPMPAVDDLWNQFLNECLNPASMSKNEDDDETDPEYNVAADPDANDEDEEALGNGIIKISKKELNDLVTELFNIMPEATADDELMADNLANSVLTDRSQAEISTRWEGKQEPISDDEGRERFSDRITFEKRGYTRFSVGKTEPQDTPQQTQEERVKKSGEVNKVAKISKVPRAVNIAIEEREEGDTGGTQRAPPLLVQRHLRKAKTQCVTIQLDNKCCILPEQIMILQQQLRQHIQLATSNFLQLYVHSVHWGMAPTFKEYLETLSKMGASNPKSVVNVCNLKPAVELVHTWEKTVSADTPENKAMVEFIHNEAERSRRRFSNKSLYVGEFHETFMNVVSNSPVFLYPYLLPPMPYRADQVKRYMYTRSEDELIALGLDQFTDYVDSNPSIFKPPPSSHSRQRRSLGITLQLVVKHIFPWVPYKVLWGHVQLMRKMTNDKDNPIYKFFEDRTITPVKHKLLPYNPKLTLYEQPEHEVPRIWVRYLSKNSKRFRNHLLRRTNVTGVIPQGIEIKMGQPITEPIKAPLPIDFTKEIVSNRINLLPKIPQPVLSDKFDIQINNPASIQLSMYKLVETTNGGYLMPITNVTTTSNTLVKVTPPAEVTNKIISIPNITNSTAPNLQLPMYELVETSNGALLMPLANVTTTSETIVKVTPPVEVTNKITPIQKDANSTAPNLQLPMFKLVETSNGGLLMPITNVTTTVNSNTKPISNPKEVTKIVENDLPESSKCTLKTNTPTTQIPTNVYKLVETSTGGYLMPLTNITTTVNTNTKPISSPAEINSLIFINKETAKCDKVPEVLSDVEHCSCCVLLRKICKERQTVIEDYFRLSKPSKMCYCKDIKYPKVSNRLRILVSNYKNNSVNALQSLDTKLKRLKQSKHSKRKSEKEMDNEFDLEDIAFVTSFQLKFLTRTTVARDTMIKKRVYTLISRFNPDVHDPVELMKKLYDACRVELVDMYKEFLCFLNPEQADICEAFRDYFVRNCVQDLVKKVETLIPSEEVRLKVLSKIHSVFYNNMLSACEICTEILSVVEGYPKLAQYVFSLFPHRKETRSEPKVPVEDKSVGCDEHTQSTQDTGPDDTICDQSHATMDYEADHSSSEEEDQNNGNNSSDNDNTNHQQQTIKNEDDVTVSDHEIQPDIINKQISTSNVHQDSCDSSNASMTIVFDEDSVKPEGAEWKRDEDKLILEVLKEHLTPEERKDRTILEMLEEKNIIDMITDSLTHKSKNEVTDRVMYLLQMLVLSET